MADPRWVIVIRLSDSFRTTVSDLVTQLDGGVIEWSPHGDDAMPAGGAMVVILAGGAENEALEVLTGLPLTSLHRFVVGALPDHRLAAAAIQRGASDYFALPDDLDLMRRSLERELREATGKAAAERFAVDERKTSGFDAIVGQSAPLRSTIDQAGRVATHRDVTVLIGGETGTGKELLARAIHYHSPRASAPFVEINCAAIPANLLESELFGHEKGSFTGAIAAKPGLFEMAHGGTLFLDEIGQLPYELQAKLLRALESREIRRVGGQGIRKIDVRVIAATHVNLAAAAARGEFREDLYYRLNVVALTLPPLRDRNGDVELLAETFLSRLASSNGLKVPPLTPEVRVALQHHSWPGNVRELRNAIERALVLSPPGTLRAEELKLERIQEAPAESALPFPAELAHIIRSAVVLMLKRTGGNKSEAARRLGISRPRLQRLLEGKTDENDP